LGYGFRHYKVLGTTKVGGWLNQNHQGGNMDENKIWWKTIMGEYRKEKVLGTTFINGCGLSEDHINSLTTGEPVLPRLGRLKRLG
jgi:hypothetical protein